MRKKNENQRLFRRGFTLIELSIVILILGILVTVMFTTLGSLLQIISSASPYADAKKQTFFALQVLRSGINQAYYLRNQKRLWFIGRKDGDGDFRQDRLTFASVDPSASELGLPSVREVSYYLRPNPEKAASYILTTREDQIIDDEPGKGGAHYEILSNVQSLKFRYTRNGKDWYEEWDNKKYRSLPLYVEIELKIEIQSKVHSFTVLARPGLNIK